MAIPVSPVFPHPAAKCRTSQSARKQFGQLTVFFHVQAQLSPIATSSERPTMTLIHQHIFTCLLLATPLSALAQGPQCAPRDQVMDLLATKYGETRQGMGIANNSAVMEVFASDNTGTWTITVSSPDGIMCLVASGQGYEKMADELPAKGDPA
jgi:hypothetical protein